MFREKSARDVDRPKVGYDSFPDSSTILVPAVETDIEAKLIQRQESAEKPTESPEQQIVLHKSKRAARCITRQRLGAAMVSRC